MKAFPWLLPLADVCINLMLVFAVLLRLSVMAATSPPIQHKDAAPTHALYMVKVEWSGQSKSDIDTYLSDPAGHLVYFKRLSDALMILDHDDTGMESNTVTMPNGEKVVSAWNSETIEIRGIIPGEYVANVQLYSQRDPEPVKVAVELYKMTGNDSIKVHDEAVMLKNKGDEVTAFRFTLTSSGDVVDINRLQKRFTGEKGTAPL